MSMKEIEASRVKIIELQRERRELEAQGRSRAEVASHIEAMVSEWHEEARMRHTQGLRLLSGGQHPSLLSADKLGHAFVLLLGVEQITKSLLADIDVVPEGLDRNERQHRIAAIDAELEALEEGEEALIVAAEDAGERVLRRADARPEVILGRREAPPAVPPRSPHYQGLGEVAQRRQRIALTPSFPGHDD